MSIVSESPDCALIASIGYDLGWNTGSELTRISLPNCCTEPHLNAKVVIKCETNIKNGVSVTRVIELSANNAATGTSLTRRQVPKSLGKLTKLVRLY